MAGELRILIFFTLLLCLEWLIVSYFLEMPLQATSSISKRYEVIYTTFLCSWTVLLLVTSQSMLFSLLFSSYTCIIIIWNSVDFRYCHIDSFLNGQKFCFIGGSININKVILGSPSSVQRAVVLTVLSGFKSQQL